MYRATVTLALGVLLLAGCQSIDGQQSRIATTMPVVADMAPNETQLYDDGKCGPGEIARYHKRGKNAGLSRSCVEAPAR